nr:coenzyme q-binding protein coq10, mitochondrial [Quercus suber]
MTSRIAPTMRPIIQSTTRSLRPLYNAPFPQSRLLQQQQQQRQTRTFLNFPASTSQSLTASRILPYPSSVIFSIISDVGSYQHYLPFCQQSLVTKTSSPAPNGKTYPEEAKLTIGISGDLSEQFWSRVYCVPDSVVEAVSGSAETTLAPEEIEHHSARSKDTGVDPSREGKVMSFIQTRWSLKPYHYKPPPVSATQPETVHMNHKETSDAAAQDMTEVNLAIEFQFANPMYAAMGQVAVPKAADKMIEAFEKRVKAVMNESKQ